MFEYLFVLASIIIGLALTHLLQGVAGIVQHPGRARPYWVHLTWVADLFLFTIFWWWFEFGYRSVTVWTFQLYAFVVCYAVLVYLTCALLFPKDLDEFGGSYKTFYQERGRWFFALLALLPLVDLVDTALKGMDHFAALGPEYLFAQISRCAVAVSLMFVRNQRYHAAMAVAAVVYQMSLIVRLFETVA